MSLSIVYITSREEPMLRWFFDSLARQVKHPQRVVVVDFFGRKWGDSRLDVVSVPPMPNVWNGPHRLTKEDWFNPAAFRNTGICHCPNDFIAFVDDVSVLMPGWIECVAEAEAKQYVVCGAYRKVKNILVEDGLVKGYQESSNDNRLAYRHGGAESCGGQWLYGCSCAGPISAFLKVGGWPEGLSCGCGFEDIPMGLLLQNSGADIRYDPRMMTFESEEHHQNLKVFIRRDKGVSPADKSHAILHKAQVSKHLDNPSIPQGIAALREHILAGGEFPVPTEPQHDWYDNQLISEMA